jgi:hypothetical protein
MVWSHDNAREYPDIIGRNCYDVVEKVGGAELVSTYNAPLERILDGKAKIETVEHVEVTDHGTRSYRTRFVPVLGKKCGRCFLPLLLKQLLI